MTAAEAKGHRDAWLRAYPGIARWHQETRSRKAREARSTLGRRRLFDPSTPDTERLNSPVQGDEADGLKRAHGLLWLGRAECPSARPVLVVHDEIVLEVDADQAEVAKAWLTWAMTEGMRPVLAPVPVRVDARVSQTWGD